MWTRTHTNVISSIHKLLVLLCMESIDYLMDRNIADIIGLVFCYASSLYGKIWDMVVWLLYHSKMVVCYFVSVFSSVSKDPLTEPHCGYRNSTISYKMASTGCSRRIKCKLPLHSI